MHRCRNHVVVQIKIRMTEHLQIQVKMKGICQNIKDVIARRQYSSHRYTYKVEPKANLESTSCPQPCSRTYKVITDPLY